MISLVNMLSQNCSNFLLINFISTSGHNCVKTMEANNDILADKPIETYIEKSILDEPDPPDKLVIP
jgi:hypothetical protein